MAIRKVGVVGCGLMGSGIAQVSVQAGFPTVVREVSQPLLDKGFAAIRKFLQGGVEKGKLAQADMEKTLANLTGTIEIRDLADCDLVVEAVSEDRALKRELLGALDAACRAETLFASNTSSLSITELATFTKRPERFLGLHFFNPVPLMKLVEVVSTLRSAPAAVREASDWCRAIGKTVVSVGDSTGFVVNRLLIPYMLDAIRVYEQGLASRDDIDNAMKLGCGYPMGPLLLGDYVGLDTTCSIAGIMFDEFREPRFAPPPLLKRMVLAGQHGRKTGRGFYDWSTNPPS
ncbi:MAG: 3-hydroxybutyryl-CoA dehydrogenase [Candidatus Eisenbacteria bacterium]|uniref:3-hydroxybutyryl-CoA dehydrogenase n=1 Tax=Eiseniibacteriota bacterium TaxID=2212470 RepID=A0A538UCJ4_UNCEI|nr:MAG: 3-hydroxybutyryl-CoA dehydrogenase [Candidatus Eisenbacteria bacterium]